jgi:hypothetical protein
LTDAGALGAAIGEPSGDRGDVAGGGGRGAASREASVEDAPASHEARRAAIIGALEAGLRARYSYARVIHEARLLDARPLLAGGWRVIPRFSLRIALASADELLESFEHNVRKHIRKAGEAALAMRRVESVEDILPTYAAAYERHGVPPPVPQPLLRETVSAVLKAGVGLAYVVEDAAGARHAFQVILVDGPRAYAWIAGADPLCLSGGGVSLLLWRVMAELAETRRELDFMGANTREIARFKVPFGGALFSFWETIHTSGTARAMLAAGALAQSVRGARRAGPTELPA